MSERRLTRRALIAGVGTTALAAPVLGQKLAGQLVDLGLPGGPSLRPTSPAFPGKGEMIVQRINAPVLETPMSVFREGVITPNDRFFVRWNWPMPTEVKAGAHRVAVGGAVKKAVSLTLEEIAAAGEPVSVVAINQCAGNGRGLSEPRVTGTQWGNGAMGCAKWTGVRLKDVLALAGGTAPSAKRVRFAGLDVPLTEGAPQFIKSIPTEIAMRDDVLVAWAMNDEPLSILHGFPLRIVVPGWFSTYWVKILSTIEVLSDEDDSYYVAKSYRVPTAPVTPEDKDFPTVPITAMPPRAFITSHADGGVVAKGKPLVLEGITFGGDAALERVDLVGDGWEVPCTLGPDEGPYAFRRWSVTLPQVSGDLARIGPRAKNVTGAVQPEQLAWNPSGYARNVIERITLRAQ